MTDLCEHEITLLRAMNGEHLLDGWGSWFGEAVSGLRSHGYCSRLPNAQITEKGREFLRREGYCD